MSQIKVYTKSGTRLGSTSKAYDTCINEELMREFTLCFTIRNNDSIYGYIAPDTVYECQGEKFDITDIDIDDSVNYETNVSAEHVSYRLNEYIIPANYAFIGTPKAIGEDILKVSGAVAEFNIGECANIGVKSFSLNNEKEVTARAAILALSKIGVEVSFNNFKINLPEKVGSVKNTPLVISHRQWQIGNGWSYDIDIADKGDICLGDTFPIVGNGIEKNTFKRIISYKHYPDDPTQNSVTLGVFISDEATAAVETHNIALSAKETADNSVQQGEKYSNVSISHENGFMATNKAGTQRVMMNGDDCFVVQVLQNGKWVTVNSLEAFGLLIDRITSQLSKDSFYIKVGKTNNGEYGLSFFIDNQESFTISSRKSGFINLFSPEFISIETNQGFKIESTAYDAMSKISGRNIQITTGNLIIKDSDKNISGSGRTEKIKFVTKNDSGENYVREFQVIQGILTI